jgi:hypothetical protein
LRARPHRRFPNSILSKKSPVRDAPSP